MTKRTKAFLAVFVVVALGAYGYLYWWANTPEHGVFDSIPIVREVSDSLSKGVVRTPVVEEEAVVEEEESVPVDTQTYKTYENTTQKFSLDYPDTWIPTVTNIDGVMTLCITDTEATGPCMLTVESEAEGVNVSEEKTYIALKAEYRAGKLTELERAVGGEMGRLLRISGEPTVSRVVVFSHEGRVYTVSALEGQETVFDRATESFRFQ
ncbi:hypothetical protein KJ819_01220 [Patescibacteria group bacterium]|nr:hypothetical protein [Patescibacteria group bacterium]MBU1500563.1 hypothetical protein [Patescibacteria group bacterium]MBU2080468.1 hypothetical protein [Patescibacteria group bacterium]MBU2123727.1 hypothetical protein [Patescibacteria group bacterium]MBU2194583.1 hypothetical protein [Patescibacteria group bacterium]